MSDTTQAQAAQLPRDHLIRVLLTQHTRIRELLATVHSTSGAARQEAFDQLRELLAIHETGEEVVLRPVSAKDIGQELADARNQEEDEAAHALAELEKLDVDGADFAARFAEFEQAVLRHAQAEENEEFPAVQLAQDPKELERLGRRLLDVEAKAPTHPHPSAAGSTAAQKIVGPFAALIDKVRDAFKE